MKRVKTSPFTQQPNIFVNTIVDKPKKSYKKLLVIGFVGIIFICLVGVSWFITDGFSDFSNISLNKNPRLSSSENIGLINTEKNLDSIAKADSIKAHINTTIDENTDLKDALFYQEPNRELTLYMNVESPVKYSKFQIIAGSFKEIENAQRYSVELKSKGFQPEIIHSGENLYRISM